MPPKKRPKLTSQTSTRKNRRNWSSTTAAETDEDAQTRRVHAAERSRRSAQQVRILPASADLGARHADYEEHMPLQLEPQNSNAVSYREPNMQQEASNTAEADVQDDNRRYNLRPRAAREVQPVELTPAQMYKIACKDVRDDEIPEHYLGKMTGICEDCGSLNFEAERTQVSKRFSNCCHGGKVDFDLPRIPELLRELVSGKTADSKISLKI